MKKLLLVNLPMILLTFFNAYGDIYKDISYRQEIVYLPLANQLQWGDYQYNEISYGECKVEYVIPKDTAEIGIKTVFLYVGGGGWFTPGEFDLEASGMPYDMYFLCQGRKTALFAQLGYKGIYPGYGLQSQLDDSIGAIKEFFKSFPNAEIYAYAFSAGANVFFNAFNAIPTELQVKLKGFVSWSPAPDPSSAAFNWCIDLLANLPVSATMEDKLAQVRKFSCAERLGGKEIPQKIRIVLMRGTLDELVTTADFQNFKEILDARSFVKTVLYYGLGHTIPWNPVIEQLQVIEQLNLTKKMLPES
jgi:hypothetical protein